MSEKAKNILATLYFSLLFFLCSADLFFAKRFFDFNFRYGQILLLSVSVFLLIQGFLKRRNNGSNAGIFISILKYWVPFAALYALSAGLSGNPQHSYLKWGWAVFNIGGAALLCLRYRQWEPLKNGFIYGVTAIASVIWAQFIALYWFWGTASVADIPNPFPCLLVKGIFLGYVQDTGFVDGIQLFRPHAFFYEPSYAGCALSFAFPLCIALTWETKKNFRVTYLAPAIVLGAILLTSARSGIMAISLTFLLITTGCLVKKRKSILIHLGKVLLIMTLLLSLLFISNRAIPYAKFVFDSFVSKSVRERISDPISREGARVSNIDGSIQLWREKPFFGMGVPPLPNSTAFHGLGMTSESMWLEVAVESGIMGFLAFCYAIGRTYWTAMGQSRDFDKNLIFTAALVSHCLISMNLTSTFPRLDYWLIFFFYIHFLIPKQAVAKT